MMRSPRTGANPAPSLRSIAAIYAVFVVVLGLLVAVSYPAAAVPALGGLVVGAGAGLVVGGRR